MTPDRALPAALPDELRALSRAWAARATDPLSALADDPFYRRECVIAAAALLRAAIELERHLQAALDASPFSWSVPMKPRRSDLKLLRRLDRTIAELGACLAPPADKPAPAATPRRRLPRVLHAGQRAGA